MWKGPSIGTPLIYWSGDWGGGGRLAQIRILINRSGSRNLHVLELEFKVNIEIKGEVQ